MEITSTTRAETLARIARRLRAHFGDALQRLFVLPEDPYAPDEMGFDYTLVAVTTHDLRDEFHRVVTEVTEDLLPEVLFIYPITARAFEEGRLDTAQTARATGVEL